MLIIRKAVEGDLEQVLAGIRQFLEETGASIGANFSETKSFPFYRAALSTDLFEMLVAEESGKIMAGLAVVIAPWRQGNPDILIAEEMGWFVLKQYRGNAKIGIRLYKEMEAKLRERGVNFLDMSSMVRMGNGEKIDRLYRKLGYEIEQVRYVKPLEVVWPWQ